MAIFHSKRDRNTIAGVCVHPGHQFECWKDDKRHLIAEGKRKDPQSLHRTLDAWLPELSLLDT